MKLLPSSLQQSFDDGVVSLHVGIFLCWKERSLKWIRHRTSTSSNFEWPQVTSSWMKETFCERCSPGGFRCGRHPGLCSMEQHPPKMGNARNLPLSDEAHPNLGQKRRWNVAGGEVVRLVLRPHRLAPRCTQSGSRSCTAWRRRPSACPRRPCRWAWLKMRPMRLN